MIETAVSDEFGRNSAFVRKLCHGADLSDADKKILIDLAQPVSEVDAGADILPEGSKGRTLPLIVAGWACRYKLLENGKRQIISVFLPGDLCEPFGVLPFFADSTIGALTAVKYTAIPLDAIHNAASSSRSIEQALWWDLLISWNIEREHIVRLGRRSAAERLGHLLCELHLRLAMIGHVEERRYDLQMTQADLSDLLGLSAVHVNRSLKELREERFIQLERSRLKIQNLPALRNFSMFDEAYLHPIG